MITSEITTSSKIIYKRNYVDWEAAACFCWLMVVEGYICEYDDDDADDGKLYLFTTTQLGIFKLYYYII